MYCFIVDCILTSICDNVLPKKEVELYLDTRRLIEGNNQVRANFVFCYFLLHYILGFMLGCI